MSKDIKKDFGGIKALEADAHAKQVAAGVQLMNKQPWADPKGDLASKYALITLSDV